MSVHSEIKDLRDVPLMQIKSNGGAVQAGIIRRVLPEEPLAGHPSVATFNSSMPPQSARRRDADGSVHVA